MEIINYLLGDQNKKIVQNTQMFHFSLDSILLPHFVTINPSISKVLDIGCGNAPIPLILSTKTKAKIIGVEIQPAVFQLAEKTIEINHLGGQIQLICDDINEYAKQLSSDQFDIITCNPPFFKYSNDSNINDNIHKSIARHEIYLNLEQIFQISKKLLKNNGVVALVHRPERLVDIMECMKKNNIEPKKIRFVYPSMSKEANILLIEGRKNGRPGVKILPPLYTHLDDGKYTKEVQSYFIG